MYTIFINTRTWIDHVADGRATDGLVMGGQRFHWCGEKICLGFITLLHGANVDDRIPERGHRFSPPENACCDVCGRDKRKAKRDRMVARQKAYPNAHIAAIVLDRVLAHVDRWQDNPMLMEILTGAYPGAGGPPDLSEEDIALMVQQHPPADAK